MAQQKSEPAFYVGRESFRMKVTPPAGQPPNPAAAQPPKPAPTPPPVVVARTPLPTPGRPLEYPPQVTPYPRQPTAELVRGITMAKSTFAGFCLIAFAFGIVTTVMIDRIWPRVEEEPATRLEPIATPTPAPRAFAPEVREILREAPPREAPPPAAAPTSPAP